MKQIGITKGKVRRRKRGMWKSAKKEKKREGREKNGVKGVKVRGKSKLSHLT